MVEERESIGGRDLRDPTTLTTQQLVREIDLLKELLITRYDTRLEAMDTAVQVFSDNLTRVPTQLQQAIENLEKLYEEKLHTILEKFTTVDTKFSGVDERFESIDVLRKESQTATATAVAAALQAAKEAVGEQTKTFTATIEKSEASTTKNMDAQAETLKTSLGSLTTQLNDAKERLTRQEGLIQSMSTTVTESLARFSELSKDFGQQKNFASENYGRTGGRDFAGQQHWGYLVGGAGLVFGVIAVVFEIARMGVRP